MPGRFKHGNRGCLQRDLLMIHELKEVGKRVGSMLNEIGFKGRPWKFNRESNKGVLQLFSLNTRDEYFFVELGVNFRFLPEMRDFELSQFGRAACEIAYRLGPEGEVDHRFSSSSAGVAELVSLMPIATRWFERYEDPSKLLSDVLPGDIAEGKTRSLFPFVTKTRQARILAYFYEHTGLARQAREFATYGLSIAGSSAGPKVEFSEMLKRLSS